MIKLILEKDDMHDDGWTYTHAGIKWTNEGNAFTRSDVWQREERNYFNEVWLDKVNLNTDSDHETDLQGSIAIKNLPESPAPNEVNWRKFKWVVEDDWLPEDGEPMEARSNKTEKDFCEKKWLTLD